MMYKITSAQIVTSVKTVDVTCNHSALGSIKIIVSGTGPFTFLWNSGQTTPEIYDLEPGTYSVKVTDSSIPKDTIVTEIHIVEKECEMDPELFFTPNGDGHNDTWSIINSSYFSNALILVYNRWGQKVYEHYGLYNVPWDGKDLLNMPVPDASYYYIVYKDRSKENDIVKGSVSIIR